jgi:hypothetical protein
MALGQTTASGSAIKVQPAAGVCETGDILYLRSVWRGVPAPFGAFWRRRSGKRKGGCVG